MITPCGGRSWGSLLPRLLNARTTALLTLLTAILAMSGSLAVPTASALPAGWGYELVSPADPLGADIDFGVGSADGDHAWVGSTIPMTADGHTGNVSSLAAVRTANGWKVRDLADASTPTNDAFAVTVRSVDGSRAIVQRCAATLLGCDRYMRFERVETDGSRSLMFDQTPFGFEQVPPTVRAASDDLSVLFIQNEAGQVPVLPTDTHTQGRGLYVSHNGQLEYIGFDQNGNVIPCGAVLASGVSGTGFEQNGVSADGATAIYEGPDPGAGCSDPVDVYVRRSGTSIDISSPRAGNPHPDLGATFLGNSRNGDTVYFRTTSQLVASDVDGFADIYAYDVPTDTVTRVTPGADVASAVVSPNGDYVYFEAFNAIAGQGTNGEQNFYVYHAGAIRYIATGTNFVLGGPMSDNVSVSPLTPDGTHLLFLATAEFTGQPLGGTRQLFQYSFASDSFSCVSCPPDGSAPTSDVAFPGAYPNGNMDQRYQSDDGRLVVFQTFDRLVPQDVNDSLDVYMWRDGVTSLVSSGRSEFNASAVSTDAAGHNIFFVATDRFTPDVAQDNTKLYDARLGGGFPFSPPQPSCSDDSCQGPPTLFPTFAAPISQTLLGPGNLKPVTSTKPSRHLSKAQKLKKALKACKSKRSKVKRKKCEAAARKRFGKSGGLNNVSS